MASSPILRYAMKKAIIATLALLGLGAAAAAWVLLVRPSIDDLGLPSPPQATSTDGVTVTWLGVSTLLIDDGETRLMTDGFFSRPGLFDLALDRPVAPDPGAIAAQLQGLGIDRLAAVMTVHSHYDHAMDTGHVARLTGAKALGSRSTVNAALGSGLPSSEAIEALVGEPYEFGAFVVTFYESRHAPLVDGGPPMPGEIEAPLVPPQPASAWREGGSYTILVEHPRATFLVQGSAGFLANALPALDVDAVFLGVGGLNRLPYDYVGQYVDELVVKTGAEWVYLVHFDDLTRSFGEIVLPPSPLALDWRLAFELGQIAAPAELLIPRFGETFSVGPR